MPINLSLVSAGHRASEEASIDGVFTAAVRCQLINTLGGDKKSHRLNVVSPSRPFHLNYAFQLHGGGVGWRGYWLDGVAVKRDRINTPLCICC